MTTVVVQQQSVRHSSATPPPVNTALSLGASNSPLPKRHLPLCPSGPAPASSKVPSSSPQSAPLKHASEAQSQSQPLASALYPPTFYPQICSTPPVYALNGDQFAAAMAECASRPLPEPRHVFPWLHGLHPENQIQLAFFVPRRRTLRRTPKCLRSIVVVKFGGDLAKTRIKGAVAPDEILAKSALIDPDPPEGFSVRNFQIQVAKVAAMSDIVVYGEDGVKSADILSLALEVSTAQTEWRKRFDPGQETPLFNTFVLSDSFQAVQNKHPELVAVGDHGQFTGQVVDFFQLEKSEMRSMSAASEISQNVWLGPTPEWPPCTEPTAEELGFDVLIETHDVATIPDPRYLNLVAEKLHKGPQRIEFPSSGSVLAPAWGDVEVYDLIDMCRWIYQITHPATETPNGNVDADGDVSMAEETPKPRRVLIHCSDGYTESSLLALAYFMFAEGVPVHDAWLRLHGEKQRNFFAYPSDVTFLTTVQNRLLLESPVSQKNGELRNPPPEPAWLSKMDGSLPSRILPYMYLGNLAHANNPGLLRELGIRRILSIGEPVSWPRGEAETWGMENVMMIDDVQDNGIDPLTQEFSRCLEFIEKGKSDCTATLVHCRVGVSRSATICIAEVMASLGLSFPRAYCFVRARRLNVIIQPHLRFVYELLKWDEHLQKQRGQPLRRDLEWATIAREIALMNKPYSRQS